MILEKELVFTLHTLNTTYLMRVNETSHLEHLYYGRRLRTTEHIEALIDKHALKIGHSVGYDEERSTLSMENLCLEYSSYGRGDYRESALLYTHENGDRVADFVYKNYRIILGKPRSLSGLAESYADATQCTTLVIELQETLSGIKLELYYYVFEQSDVIGRRAALTNTTQSTLELERLASCQLDFFTENWDLVTFDGAWARERQNTRRPLSSGTVINDTKTGNSSKAHNPAIFLATPSTTEQWGDCYGCNLVYSGDHAQMVEVSPYGKVRLLSLINPATFRWQLKSGEKFTSPEALLTFSHEGLNGLSRHFHTFINEHITRGVWKQRQRPIAFNHREVTFYDYDEQRVLGLAKEAAKLGMELFVLDDGWFGTRNDDSSSLGDWTLNTKRLPNGIAQLSKAVHDLDMMFGLWCEPEMLSMRSELYRQHPDWVVQVPGRTPSPGRNQYTLDLTREEVRDYLFESLSTLWQIAKVDYVKWDLNRPLSDAYSQSEQFRQNEFHHRYILGLYSLLERLTKAFPNVLFEAANRFDLGILCYVSQCSASDNSDIFARVGIQEGTSYAYPNSTVALYVTPAPHHQTLRVSNLESRFNVASFGVLGYQLDLPHLSLVEREIVRSQIAFYKLHRSLLQYGVFSRLEPLAAGANRTVWLISNADYSEMLLLYFQSLVEANAKSDLLRIEQANPNYIYSVTPRKEQLNFSHFKNLLNEISPVHFKKESSIQRFVAEKIAIENEVEHYTVPGDMLAYGGIKLNQQFSGTGYTRETRVLGDFGSRLYHFKRIN